MRNRILSITRSVIPYVKELHPLTGSVHGCLIMQQLDYWFTAQPEGFYKFLEPTEHASYKPGDSWVEELGMTHNEFRGAFDKIGTRYKSRSEFEAVKKAGQDPFNGKFYLSFVDRKKNLTYYRRNHQLLDLALDSLINDGCTPSPILHQDSAAIYRTTPPEIQKANVTDCSIEEIPVSWNSQLHNLESGFTGNLKSKLQEIDIPSSRSLESKLYKAENQSTPVSEITTETTTTTTAIENLSTEAVDNPNTVALPLRGGCDDSELQKTEPSKPDLIWPLCAAEERTALEGIIKTIPASQHQILLDEIEGARRAGSIRTGLVPFASSLVRAMLTGTFTVGHAPAVAARRREAATRTEAISIVRTFRPEIAADAAAEGQRLMEKIRQQSLSRKKDSSMSDKH